MTTKRHPAAETYAIGAGTFICGIPVQPDHTEPVSMRSRHHPGFGAVTLQRNGKTVDCDVHGEEPDGNHTLQWYENRASRNPRARWEIVVDGPMSGYVMRRIRGNWYVTETRDGFA